MTTKTARRLLPPDDPRHGTVAGNVAGCGCLPCRQARNQWKVNRLRRIAYGTWKPFLEAEPVREHLATLTKAGIGYPRAADLAGLSRETVRYILYGKGSDKAAPRRIRVLTAEAILAVQPTLDNCADNAVVPALGAVRRLRALVALGYPMLHLGDRLPGHPEAMRRLIRYGHDQVTAKVARAARDMYNTLPVPADSPQSRRARNFATAMGWAPTGAWDVDTIDDPDATPQVDAPAGQNIDEVLVRRALAGQTLLDTLNDAEQVALWQAWMRHRREHRLEGPGLTDFARLHRIGVNVAERLRNTAEGLNSRGKPSKTTTGTAATGRTTERTAA